MSCHAYHGGPRRYTHHENPAIRFLNAKLIELPLRSIEHDIVACAMLYLEGDLQPGGSVERWWKLQDRREREFARTSAGLRDRTSLTAPAWANQKRNP